MSILSTSNRVMQVFSCILVFDLLFVVIKASPFYAKDSTNIAAHKLSLKVKTQSRQQSPLENPGLFEGDIKLPPKVSGLQSNGIKIMYATAYETLLWPKGIVYFENKIEDDEFLDLLENAMTEIESKTSSALTTSVSLTFHTLSRKCDY